MPAKKYIVTLTSEERSELEALVSKGKTAAVRIKHAHILLASDIHGPLAQTDAAIAQAYHCHHRTVEEIRQRFVEEGLEAALERKKRIYTPKKMDGRCEAKLISLACSTPPKGCERWTLRMLADKLVELEVVDSISCETVRKQLKKTNFNRIEKDAG